MGSDDSLRRSNGYHVVRAKPISISQASIAVSCLGTTVKVSGVGLRTVKLIN